MRARHHPVSDRLIPGWLLGLVALAVAVLIGVSLAGPAIREVIDEVAELAPERTAPPTDALGVPIRSSGPFEPGRIRFGTAPGASRCLVDGTINAPIEPFPAGVPLYVAAFLRTASEPGADIVLLHSSSGPGIETYREDQDPSQPQCWSNRVPIGPLEPGNYVFTIIDDQASQAEGALLVE